MHPKCDEGVGAQQAAGLLYMCLSQVKDEQVSLGPVQNQLTLFCSALRETVSFRFLGCDDRETYFTNTQRHRVVSSLFY